MGMILHHSLNYFLPGYVLVKYVRFVTGAFVFITGFLITNIYFKKYNIHESKIYIRLFSRGLKLLLLFVILNAATSLLLNGNFRLAEPHLNGTIENLYSIFISGNYRIVDFALLLPISYCLLIMGALIFFSRQNWSIICVSVLLLIFCSVEFFITKHGGYNLRYLTIGLCGAAFGLIPIHKFTIPVIYWVLLIFIYISHVIYLPLLPLYYPIYVSIVILNLTLFYVLGSKLDKNHILVSKVILVGKYSLFSYLFQIAFLQVLKRSHLMSSFQVNITALAFILTTIATISAAQLTEHLRKKISLIRKTYSLIFA